MKFARVQRILPNGVIIKTTCSGYEEALSPGGFKGFGRILDALEGVTILSKSAVQSSRPIELVLEVAREMEKETARLLREMANELDADD